MKCPAFEDPAVERVTFSPMAAQDYWNDML